MTRRAAVALYRGMPFSRVAPPRLAVAIAATAMPVALALVLLWGFGELRTVPALAALAVAGGGVAILVHRHLAGLESLRSRLEALARGGSSRAGESGITAAELADRIAELDRGWVRRGEESRALAAANEAILEAIPDPLILIDAGRTIARANPAARALFGETVAGHALDSVLRHPDVLAAVDACLAGARAPESIDLPWPGPPEREFAVLLARLPVHGAAAGAAGDILLVLHDVTALKQAERMRADFVANVSHELRTPLASLLGIAETLRGAARDDAPARERFLVIMHEQTQRMSRLVSDLLSLSRIEESEYSRPVDAVALGRVIGSVVDALAVQAKGKGMRIDLAVPPDLPAVVGDADQLAQVFQNLIDNAIKYSRAQGQIRIVGRVADPPPRLPSNPAGWVAVAVSDEGEGIAREHLPRLTERFYRVDTARSRQLGGTGLGLAIVKHVLNRHRGALTIDSEPGRGSIFTVWLPVAPR